MSLSRQAAESAFTVGEMLPLAYRLTKYDPAKRDAGGAFVGGLAGFSDVGWVFDGLRLAVELEEGCRLAAGG
jgi:hypothetical protein